jgi:hypothetical protein
MEPVEIKIELMRAGKGNLSALAREFSIRLKRPPERPVRREEVSMCIRQVREYPALQTLIAETIRKPREQVFGSRRQRAA